MRITPHPILTPFTASAIALFTPALPLHATAPSEARVVAVDDTVHVEGTLESDDRWSPGRVYVVTSFLQVPEQVTLTLDPGVVIKMESSDGIYVAGTLIAQGTESDPVVFTSIADDEYGGDSNGDEDATSPAAGDWSSLSFAADATGIFDHVIARFGGRDANGLIEAPGSAADAFLAIRNSVISDSESDGIYAKTGAVVTDNVIERNARGIWLNWAESATVTNNIIRDNRISGIHADYSPVTITGNKFSGNGLAMHLGGTSGAADLRANTYDGMEPVRIERGEIFRDTIWQSGTSYVIDGAFGIQVYADATLTLEPGAVMKLASQAIYVSGTLLAEGTPDDPIIFTSLKDDEHGGDSNGDGAESSPAAGDWSGLSFAADATGLFDHVIARFGGRDANGLIQAPGSAADAFLTIRNSVISDSESDGIYAKTGAVVTDNVIERNARGIWLNWTESATITGNTIRNNRTAGIHADNSLATISGNVIIGNESYGISHGGPIVLDARFNFWGDAGGPYDPSDDRSWGGFYNPAGRGDQVTDYVDYTSWLRSPGAPPPPLPDSPVNEASNISFIPTLSWSPIAGAVSYELQVSPAASFEPMIVNEGGITETSRMAYGLSNGVTYYWRVRAVNEVDVSIWSDTRSFSTKPGVTETQRVSAETPQPVLMPLVGLTIIFASLASDTDVYASRNDLAPDDVASEYSIPLIHYWTIEQQGASTFRAEVCFSLSGLSGLSGDASSLLILKRSGQEWSVEQSQLSATHICAHEVSSFGDFAVVALISGTAAEPPAVPRQFFLAQNYPNPFSTATTIEFEIPEAGEISIIVYNLLGERVATIVSGIMPAGSGSMAWDAATLPAGAYIYELRARVFAQKRMFVLLR